jgi:hypothetical protein
MQAQHPKAVLCLPNHCALLPPPPCPLSSSWNYFTLLVQRTSTDEKGDPDLFGGLLTPISCPELT